VGRRAILAQHAESVGLHGVWVCDHFMPYAGAGRPAAGPVLEGWRVLTAVAARTTRIRLGTLVLGASYRHPAVVAKMAATLDHGSDDRLTLGLGAGWQPNEHTAYGIELLPPVARLARFAEYVVAIRSLLREPSTTVDGAWFRPGRAGLGWRDTRLPGRTSSCCATTAPSRCRTPCGP
jgi:alkanesulfonate monooxygenase SsuD/methylene tetrahydromethanopterin reductase-like flavin-dependent oxidoreductase (luciferase family)